MNDSDTSNVDKCIQKACQVDHTSLWLEPKFWVIAVGLLFIWVAWHYRNHLI